MSRIFTIVLALAMTLPVSAMFSTNAIAETADSAEPLSEIFGDNTILEDAPEIPTPPEVPSPENFKLPDVPPESPDNITYEEIKLPVFEHVEEPYNITLVTIESPTGPLYEGINRPIHVTLKNKADHKIKDITVNIYDQLDDGGPVFLTDLHYGCIPNGKEQKKTFTWTPEAGTHHLSLNISYVENGIEQVNEEEFGFHVSRGLQNTDGQGSDDSYPGNPNLPWYIYGETIIQNNYLILDDGVPNNLYLEFHAHNIFVTSTGSLTLENTEFEIRCTSDGQYTITVEHGGTLEVLGDSLITASSSRYQGYDFEVYGTLNFIGTPAVMPTIQWMYGDMGDETVPAGIQLYRDSEATFEYANIVEGESHNIYADGAEFTVTGCDISGAQSQGIACGIYAINGAEMHVTRHTEIANNGHSGIFSVASSVDIDGAIVSSNPDYGVAVIGDIEEQPGGGAPFDQWFEPWGSRSVVGAGAPCYDIWLDDSPDKNTWHVRWTGNGLRPYDFRGIIDLDGPLSYFMQVGSVDWIITDSFSIEFGDSENQQAGFDFRFEGSKVIFDLQVSLLGQPVTLVAYIGSTGTNCDINPFRIYQMRPPIMSNFEIQSVDTGVFIHGRASGQVSDFNIIATDQSIMLYSGARNNQISNGYAHSGMSSATFACFRSGSNTFHDLDLYTKYGHDVLFIGEFCDNNQIRNVHVNLDSQARDSTTGFDFVGSNGNTINNCEASNCLLGLLAAYSSDNSISDFFATDCIVGVELYAGSRNSLSSCSLNYNGGGFYALVQNQLSISSTSINNNGFQGADYWTYGMVFNQCSGVTVTNSRATDNKDPDAGDIAAGLVAINSDHVTIKATQTSVNDYGVMAQGCSDLKLGDNVLSSEIVVLNNRQWGVALTETSGILYDAVINSIASGIYIKGPMGPGALQDIDIQGGEISGNGVGEYGIFAVNDANIKIKRSMTQTTVPTMIMENQYGIVLENSKTEIRETTIMNNENEGIYAYNNAELNIMNSVTHPFTTITENQYGITLLNSDAYITDASIIDNNKGGIDAFSSTIKVFDSEVKDNSGFGIHLEQCTDNVEITGNTISGNNEPNWPGPEPQFSGIKVSNSDNVWIHDNPEIMGNSANIYIVNSDGVIVEWNTIIDASAVVQIYPTPPPPRGIYSISSQITASNNMIWGTIIGIDIEDADGCTVISDNGFQPLVESPPNPAIGIRLISASVKVERNTFDSIETGINCSYSSPLILDNEFDSCYWGIKALYGAPLNSGTHGDGLVTDNTFSNDLEGDVIQYWWLQVHVEENGQGVSDESVTVWELGGGEPYWSGFTGPDGNTEKINVVEYYWDADGQQQYIKTPHLIMVRTELHPNIEIIHNWVEDFYFP